MLPRKKFHSFKIVVKNAEVDGLGFQKEWNLGLEEAQRNTELLWFLFRLPERMRNQVGSWQSLTILYSQHNRIDRKEIVPVHLDADKSRYKSKFCRFFLRTYAYDVELLSRSIGETMVDTRIFNPLQEKNTNPGSILRLNMLALISELNIVVVGSQSGNVCLLTLTRLDDPAGILPPFLSMRLERRLPYLSQKNEFQPRCPLLGMAVSPLQGMESCPMKGYSRRWRLILHYYDHTILSYDLGREGDDLSVL